MNKKEPDNKKALVKSIYDKNLEVRYNCWYIKNRDHKWVKLDLQGKIKCPAINASISSLACSKIMEKDGWPRSIDENICKKCTCYVYLSIKKFKEKSKK